LSEELSKEEPLSGAKLDIDKISSLKMDFVRMNLKSNLCLGSEPDIGINSSVIKLSYEEFLGEKLHANKLVYLIR